MKKLNKERLYKTLKDRLDEDMYCGRVGGAHFWVDPVNQITAIYMRSSRWYDSHGCGTIGAQFERDVMSCLE